MYVARFSGVVFKVPIEFGIFYGGAGCRLVGGRVGEDLQVCWVKFCAFGSFGLVVGVAVY